MLLELLRQRHNIRSLFAKVRGVVKNARRVRSQPCEEARSRGVADWILAIRSIEQNTARGQPVNIRAMNVRLSVATEFRPQIVQRDEEDVGLLSRKCCASANKQRGREDEFHRCDRTFPL